ncbi:hypothetical protein LCGC14_1721340 [marine sediment metagenome]|uniref:Band 7 domain-containing protein n=1 Tax=marine sediment metagenome TaxID=412755 RepID=A0A0F9HCD7_9ZZZZ
MIVLFILGIIAAIVGFLIRWSAKTEEKDARMGGGITLGVGSFMVILSLILGSLVAVPAGHRGVIVRFNAVTGRTLEQGLNAKIPFIDGVRHISIQSFKHEVPASAASNDLQTVSTTIALNYHLLPEGTSEVYRTLGHTGIQEYIVRFADPLIQETVKQVTARFQAEDLILKREEVKQEIAQVLTQKLTERFIVAETVSITDFQFSATFTASIEAKVSAEQAVFEAENKLRRIEVEARQVEAAAVGEANARMAQAEGEAEYITVVTAAQVAANNAISETLTDAILQYILLDRLGGDIKLMVIPNNQGFDLVLPSIE